MASESGKQTSADPIERQARELAREAANLPGHWQLWLFELLRDQLASAHPGEYQAEQRSEEMTRVVRALKQVAEHLGLNGEAERLALTMREFDHAPVSTRGGLKARQAKIRFGDSWSLAKAAAFGGKPLPLDAYGKQSLRRQLPDRRRETAHDMAAIREWLAVSPPKRSRAAYETWRKKHNEQLPAGSKPAPAGTSINNAWHASWGEIVKAAEANTFPASSKERSLVVDEDALRALRDQPLASPVDFIDDPTLRARRLAQVREASGLTSEDASRRAGLALRVIGEIESGKVINPKINTLIKLAKAFEISLDSFATDDGQAGLPAASKVGRPSKKERNPKR